MNFLPIVIVLLLSLFFNKALGGGFLLKIFSPAWLNIYHIKIDNWKNYYKYSNNFNYNFNYFPLHIDYSDNGKTSTIRHWPTEIILPINHIFKLLISSVTTSADYYHPCEWGPRPQSHRENIDWLKLILSIWLVNWTELTNHIEKINLSQSMFSRCDWGPNHFKLWAYPCWIEIAGILYMTIWPSSGESGMETAVSVDFMETVFFGVCY